MPVLVEVVLLAVPPGARAVPAPESLTEVTYEVNDTQTMVEFVRNGLAIGMLPQSLLETTGEIAFVPIRDHAPEFRTTIAIPANRRLSAATRAMLETIRRHTGA